MHYETFQHTISTYIDGLEILQSKSRHRGQQLWNQKHLNIKHLSIEHGNQNIQFSKHTESITHNLHYSTLGDIRHHGAGGGGAWSG